MCYFLATSWESLLKRRIQKSLAPSQEIVPYKTTGWHFYTFFFVWIKINEIKHAQVVIFRGAERQILFPLDGAKLVVSLVSGVNAKLSGS